MLFWNGRQELHCCQIRVMGGIDTARCAAFMAVLVLFLLTCLCAWGEELSPGSIVRASSASAQEAQKTSAVQVHQAENRDKAAGANAVKTLKSAGSESDQPGDLAQTDAETEGASKTSRGSSGGLQRRQGKNQRAAGSGENRTAAAELPPSGTPALAEIILPPKNGAESLKETFLARQSALKNGDEKAAAEAESKILELRESLAISDLFLFSQVVLAEAEEILQSDPGTAAARAVFASQLAPDYSAPYWMKLHADLLQSRTEKNEISLKNLWQDFRSAVNATVSSPLEKNIRILDWIFMIPLAFVIAVLAFFLICLIRSARYMLHDLSHLTPSGVGSIFRFILVAAVTVLLWQTGSGAFLPMAFIGFLILPYLSISEKFIALIAFLAVGFIPMTSMKLSEQNPFLSPDMQALYFLDRDGLGGAPLSMREDQLRTSADRSYAISYVLGRKALRFGNYEEARPFLRHASRLFQSSPDPWIALGNIELIKGDMQAAYENYTRARQHSSYSPEAAFNLSSYYIRRVAIAKAGLSEETPEQILRMKGQAKALFDESVMLSSQLASIPNDMRANIFVLTAPIGMDSLAASSNQKKIAERLCGQINQLLFGGHSPDWAIRATLTVIAVWFLYSIFRGMVPASTPCFRCGAPACGRCEELRCPSPGLCPDCFNAFGQKSRVPSMDAARREVQIRSSRIRQKILIMFSSLVIPGSGDFWLGRSVLGFVIVFLSVLLGALIAFPHGFFPLPFDTIPDDLKRLPAAAVLAAVWLAHIILTWRGIQRVFPTKTSAPSQSLSSGNGRKS